VGFWDGGVLGFYGGNWGWWVRVDEEGYKGDEKLLEGGKGEIRFRQGSALQGLGLATER
jgi:hypothetical protein